MEIIFCKQCGRRIKHDEFQNNQFTQSEGQYYCINCVPLTASVPGAGAGGETRRKSSAIIRPKTTSQSAVARSKTGKLPAVESPRPPSAHQIPSYKPKPDKKPPVALYAGIGLAVLAIGILIAILAANGTNPPPAGPTTEIGGNPGGTGGPRPPGGGTPVPPGGSNNPNPGGGNPSTSSDGELAALFDGDIESTLRRSLEGPRPKTLINAAAAAPVVDGDLNDAVWAGAAVLTDFTDEAGTGSAAATHEGTTVRILHHGGVLYVAGECDVPEGADKLILNKTGRDESLWSEESVELFLVPPTAKNRYAHIMVSPKGVVYDALNVLGERDSKVNFNTLKAAAKTGGNRWTFEFSVACSDFFGIPAGRWRINAYRNRFAAGQPARGFCWKAVGKDFHFWPQFNEVDFQGAPPSDIAAAQELLRNALPDYQAVRQAQAALKTTPLALDSFNLAPKPRLVTLPICPVMSAADAGAVFDAPVGTVNYFNTSAGLRPAGDAGVLRFGSLTGGSVAHLRLTARMTGGTTDRPRALGLVLHSAPGAARQQMGVIGLVVVDGQVTAVSLSRPEGSTMTFNYLDKAPLFAAPVTARPFDFDFNAEPDRVEMFVDGRLAAVLPWPAESNTAAEVVGLFTQNSGIDLYKFLATPGIVAQSRGMPPFSAILSAPDWLAGTAVNGGFGLYPDPSAASGLTLATTQDAYTASHGGKPLAGDSDLAVCPAADLKVTLKAGTPYRAYARIRNAGVDTGIAPRFWMQAGSQEGAENAAFAPGQNQAYVFQRTTTNARDWGWVTLTHAQTRLPVQLTFMADTEIPLRLITGTPDAALDQVVLLPAGANPTGLEINDDTEYIGGRIPPTFTLAGLQKQTLTAANDVAAVRYPFQDGAPGGNAQTNNPPPVLPSNPTPVASADGFVAQVRVAGMKILPAADGMAGVPDQAGSTFNVPQPLVNAYTLIAARAGWLASQGSALSFDLKNDAMVFVALNPAEAAAKAMLDELAGDGFERSSLLLQQVNPAVTYQLVRRRYAGGAVRFVGHNLGTVAPVIFVLPLDTTPRQPVDPKTAVERGPGIAADSYASLLRADELAGAIDTKKIGTAVIHKVDILPRTPLNQPAWVFHGTSGGRTANDTDASYITVADNPTLSRASGAISFWVYLGGTSTTRHTILARKVGNQTKTLEIAHGGLASSFGDKIIRAKTPIPSHKWTWVVWNFGPDGQQFIVDGTVEDLQAVPADLSGGGEMRVGNDYQKDSLEGCLAELAVHNRTIDSAKPPESIPPALKLNMTMEKMAEPGAVVVFGFESASGLPKEADLSGNGLDGVWGEYKGAVTGGQSVTIDTERDRVVAIKRGAKANPYLTVPADPNLDLTSGSIYMTINLDKAAIKKVTGDANRCLLIEQTNGARTDQIYFGDTLTSGFFFSVLQSKAVGQAANSGVVKAKTDMEGGKWYRVAFTWTPKTIRYYQNGVLMDEAPNTGFKLDGKNKPLVFFGRENDALRGFVGSVGQLKIYTYARTVWE